jgi:carbon monoxide dehydrogenase subunit G
VKLSNTFEIDRPLAEVFDVFLEIERVATCMPGSRLTGQVDDSTYEGEVKIKVGPLAVVYAGQASLVEIDKEARQLTLRAKGREKRGAGNADALIVAQLSEHVSERGSGTQVVIDSDLSIRGKVAQFGQGAIGEVAGGLMQQFARNVEVLLAGGDGQAPATSAADLASSRPPAIKEASAAENTDTAALSGWRLIVVPLARKSLPTVVSLVCSGVASYVGARIAIGRATRRR